MLSTKWTEDISSSNLFLHMASFTAVILTSLSADQRRHQLGTPLYSLINRIPKTVRRSSSVRLSVSLFVQHRDWTFPVWRLWGTWDRMWSYPLDHLTWSQDHVLWVHDEGSDIFCCLVLVLGPKSWFFFLNFLSWFLVLWNMGPVIWLITFSFIPLTHWEWAPRIIIGGIWKLRVWIR